MTLLEGDVNFLFDEQVIQDERLLTLEQTTDAINAELVSVDDDLESKTFLRLTVFVFLYHWLHLKEHQM